MNNKYELFAIVFVGIVFGFIWQHARNVNMEEGAVQPQSSAQNQNTQQAERAPVAEERESFTTQSDNGTTTVGNTVQTGSRQYRSKYGFELMLPAAWITETDGNIAADRDILLRVHNPNTVPVPDTDIPTEWLAVMRINAVCDGKPISVNGLEGFDSGWVEDLFAPGLLWSRTRCFSYEGGYIKLSAIAFGKETEALLDPAFSTFVLK